MAEAPASQDLTDMADDKSTKTGASDQLIDPWCEPCLEDLRVKIDVFSYCPRCNVCFCKVCDESHRKMPISRNQKVVHGQKIPKSYTDKPIMYPICSIHAGSKLDHYCQDHHIMVCDVCVKQDHEGCSARLVAEVCKDLGLEDIKHFKALIDSMKTNLNTTKTDFKNDILQLNGNEKTWTKQAEYERDKIIEKAKQYFENTVKNITECCTRNKSKLTEQIFKLDDEIHSLDAVSQNVERKINVVDNVERFDQNTFIQMQEIVGYALETKRELDNLSKQLHRVELTFTPTKAISFNSNTTLGDIREELLPNTQLENEGQIYFPLQPSTPLGSVSWKIPSDVTQISVKKLSSFRVYNHKRPLGNKGRNSIGAIVVTDDGKLLVSYVQGRRVELFKLDGQFLSSLRFNCWCNGMAAITGERAVVSTWDFRLHFLDLSDSSSMSVQRSIFLEDWVISITACNDKMIFIPSIQNYVKMIDQDGQQVWSKEKGPDGQRLFKRPCSVKIQKLNDKDVVVVSDWGKQSIFLLDATSGALLRTIDTTGKDCRGLTVDRSGNIFVCCNIREVCFWSSDFMKSGVVLKGQDIKPQPVLIEGKWNTHEIFVSYYGSHEIDSFQVS